MLVLSRKKNERIVINDNITIVVVEIRGDKVRLGIEAPKEVPVHRQEVFDAIKAGERKVQEEEIARRLALDPLDSRSIEEAVGPAEELTDEEIIEGERQWEMEKK
ncbi:hypothetical protein LCGC14_0248590 [marine sediment metagenome]|uniref:Carbon storage regulator n=1 Tax=marine sediment metagenome TaxID=412755 RepID=A0A0F9ULI8_9ZZZZ